MKLKECLELALEMGCTTIFEAGLNAERYCDNVYPIERADEELSELYPELMNYSDGKLIVEVMEELKNDAGSTKI